MDTLHSEYSELLLALDPTLMKAYKNSLSSDTIQGKKAFLNDFSSAKNAEKFFEGRLNDSSNEDISDINAMRASKDKNGPRSKNSKNFEVNERTQHRQSEDKDRISDQRDDRIRDQRDDRIRDQRNDRIRDQSDDRTGIVQFHSCE